MNRTLLVCVVALLAHAAPAHADDRPIAAAASAAAAEAQIAITAEVKEPAPREIIATRPGSLMGMYAACGLLNAYDGYSTIKAIATNHVELNPVMAPIVKQPGLVIVAKAAMTVVTIATAENLWRHHHRTQAVVLLAVSNGLMAAVAAHNAIVLRGQR